MDADTTEPDGEFALMVCEQTAAAFGFWWSGGTLHYHAAGISRRCPACHPGCWTPPLRIDGHEYHRRQRARRRRRR